MGYYINENSKGKTLEVQGKAKGLVADGAKIVSGEEFVEDLICVVKNGLFEAAGYAYNEAEWKIFSQDDGRLKLWLVHPDAKELSGFNK